MTAWYADSSAIVKLVVREPESTALRRFVTQNGPELLSSQLLVTELGHFAQRMLVPERDIDKVLSHVGLLLPSSATFEAARRLPGHVRALDALHVAAALEVADDVAGLISYDTRMLDAARAAGLRAESPT